MVITSQSDLIEVGVAPIKYMDTGKEEDAYAGTGNCHHFDSGLRLKDALRRFEKHYIAGSLQQCGHKVDSAAGRLGINRSGLYKKIQAYGLSVKKAPGG
jgi:DNA-binding NtrC family response regulator